MDLSVHFVVSAIFAAVLYPFFGWISLLFVVGGFLIDADHYLWSVLSNKSFSLKRSYEYHKDCGHRDDYILHVCHTVEFAVLTIILVSLYPFFAIFAAGYFIHLVLDRIYAIYYSHRHHRAFRFFWFNDQKGQRAFSLVHWILVELGLAKMWRFGAVDEEASVALQEKNMQIISSLPMYSRESVERAGS